MSSARRAQSWTDYCRARGVQTLRRTEIPWPCPDVRAGSDQRELRRRPGWSAAVEPPPGSTVNANALELPRSGSTAVVDGATAAASMVPADCGAVGADQPHLVDGARLGRVDVVHHQHARRCARGRTPPSRCRRSGCRPTRCGRRVRRRSVSAAVGFGLGPHREADADGAEPMATAAAAANVAVRQRVDCVGRSSTTVARRSTAASRRSRR